MPLSLPPMARLRPATRSATLVPMPPPFSGAAGLDGRWPRTCFDTAPPAAANDNSGASTWAMATLQGFGATCAAQLAAGACADRRAGCRGEMPEACYCAQSCGACASPFDLDEAPLPSEKNIFMFWEDADASTPTPEVVALATRSWRAFNPDWDVHVLTSASPLLPPWATWASRTVDVGLAGATDVLRTYLLAKHGGVWADASVLCFGPIDAIANFTARHGLWVPRQDAASRTVDRQVSTWAMAARRGDPTLTSWFAQVHAYVFGPRAHPLLGEPVYGVDARVGRADLALAPGDVGFNVTGRRALDALGEHGRWPYYFAHYLLNQVLLDNDELAARWRRSGAAPDPPVAAFEGMRDPLRPAALVLKTDRRADGWRRYAPALEALMAQAEKGRLKEDPASIWAFASVNHIG